MFKDKKPKALEKLNSEQFKDGDRIWYDAGISGNLREEFKNHAEVLTEKFENIKTNLQTLVKTRNDIFKSIRELDPIYEYLTTWAVKNNELGNYLKYFDKFESSEKFSIYHMCGIELKKRGGEPQTDCYMTEDDSKSLVDIMEDLNQ